MSSSLFSKFNVRTFYASRYAATPGHFHGLYASPLYKKISPLGHPDISLTPVLDQWVREGNTVTKRELQNIVRELISYKRFKHALEISIWMSDRRYFPLSCSDLATRLNLIWRVHGIEQVENFFNGTSVKLRRAPLYTALLNCYVQEKAVEKAEGMFQKMRDMGLVKDQVPYNLLMKLYYETGNHGKLDDVMSEMKKNGLKFDLYTVGIRLSGYAASSDIEGMDKIVERVETYTGLVPNWNFYAVAAGGYLQVGSTEKTMAMLKKLEELVTAKPEGTAFDQLLGLYGRMGKKDEVHRIWNLYKEKLKMYNRGYKNMIRNLLQLNDIEAAERILEDWELKKFSYDFTVPDLLVNAYCKNGLLEKAESLINRELEKGAEPSVDTWYSLTTAFLEADQIPKAKEALKKAILVYPPSWKPKKELLVTCLEYLEGKGDQNNVEEFMESLRTEGMFSPIVQTRLLTYIKGQAP